jgi:predicted PurR-regulated permease PerM
MSGDGPSFKSILRVVAAVAVVFIGLYLAYLLRKPITWIVIGGFIAIAVSGPIRWLQHRGAPRGLAILGVYLGLILTPVLVGAVLVPPIVTEANNLAETVPTYVGDLQEFVRENKRLRELEEDYDITGQLQEQAAELPAKLGGAAGVLSDIGLGLVNSLFATITILILSVFMVGSGGRWLQRTIARQPQSQQPMLRRTAESIGAAVGAYCAGALGQALIAGVTAFIVLSILGVPYAAALALIVALLDLVPLVGATLGAIVVGIVTLFSDFPTDTIIWVAWSVAYQQIENTIIQPRIQAKAVQVAPFTVLVAVLFGSTLFGVLGALLAIPFAAAVQITMREYRAYKTLAREAEIAAPGTGPTIPPAGPASGVATA